MDYDAILPTDSAPALLKDTSGLVAHYTSMATACDHILRERKIRFSPMRCLNDPRENKERMVGVGWSGDRDPTAAERVQASDALKRAYIDYSKVFCGTTDAHEQPEYNTKRCFGRPRMWAQYGDNHRGACILFRRDLLDAAVRSTAPADSEVFADEVVYDDHLKPVSAAAGDLDYDLVRESGVDAAIRNQVRQLRRAIFFRKDSDWSGESEYRWVIHRWSNGHEFVPYADAIFAVVMGVDSADSRAVAIRSLVGTTPVVKLEWDDQREDFDARTPR